MRVCMAAHSAPVQSPATRMLTARYGSPAQEVTHSAGGIGCSLTKTTAALVIQLQTSREHTRSRPSLFATSNVTHQAPR